MILKKFDSHDVGRMVYFCIIMFYLCSSEKQIPFLTSLEGNQKIKETKSEETTTDQNIIRFSFSSSSNVTYEEDCLIICR